MAHEINSPLAYALMNLELSLESLPQDDPAALELQQMLKSCEEGMLRVKEIVTELKTFFAHPGGEHRSCGPGRGHGLRPEAGEP